MRSDYQAKIPDVVRFCCRHKEKGCVAEFPFEEIITHKRNCVFAQFRQMSHIKRGPGYDKARLIDVNRQYAKQQRLGDIIAQVDTCTKQHEKKIDVLFFMLHLELEEKESSKAKPMYHLWSCSESDMDSLSVDQCLALKGDTLQTKTMYKKMYDFMKAAKQNTFLPPSKLDNREAHCMPDTAEYRITNSDGTPARAPQASDLPKQPLSVLESFNPSFPEFPTPNCRGYRWHYPSAVAKPLEELDSVISESLQRTNLDQEADLILNT